jgi:hypothetical protein
MPVVTMVAMVPVVALVPFLMFVAAVIGIVTFAAIVPTIVPAIIATIFRAVFVVFPGTIGRGPGGRVGHGGGLPGHSRQRGKGSEEGYAGPGMGFHGCSVNMAIGLGDTVSLGT